MAVAVARAFLRITSLHPTQPTKVADCVVCLLIWGGSGGVCGGVGGDGAWGLGQVRSVKYRVGAVSGERFSPH